VVSANVEYPTDSGLLAHAVTLIGKLVKRIKSAGGATRTVFRDASEAAAGKVRAIGAKLKLRTAEGKQEAQATVLRLTGELADLAQRAITEAGGVLDNARRALGRVAGRQRGQMHRAINELSTVVVRAARIVAQGRRRVAGEKIESATRLVSLHDPAARPIVKGRLGKPVEFGYKAQVVDNEDGLVLDYDVKVGNPADAEQLAPAIRRISRRLGRVPEQGTADRGYGEASVDRELEALGVQTVVIPRKGKPGKARQAVEHSPEFRELVKWRTAAKAASATSNADTAGTAASSTDPTAPPPGAATASSPTTSSRSPKWAPPRHENPPGGTTRHGHPRTPTRRDRLAAQEPFFKGK
jgi:IS5 family transposase